MISHPESAAATMISLGSPSISSPKTMIIVRAFAKKRIKENSLNLQNKSLKQYDYGIGKKLLDKMGYKGKGLGKNEQGIIEPIQVKERLLPHMGLGYKDPNECGNLCSKKPKMAKVLPVLSQKVEGRVKENLCNLNSEERAKEDDVLMLELQHDIGLIVDLVGFDIPKIDKDLRKGRETALRLKDKKDRLEIEMAKQKKQLDSLVEIMSDLDQLEEDVLMETFTAESLSNWFSDLQKRYAANDYKLCNLYCIAFSFALPLFSRVFQGWNPLRNPSYGLELVSSWKALLQGDGSTSLYAQLLYEVVVPAIRISGINAWDARNPEPMLRFLDSWEELLPSSILDTILDDIVKPKLKSAVNSWEPYWETIPIHDWLHPWLPLFGHKLDDVYQTIVSKLSHTFGACASS